MYLAWRVISSSGRAAGSALSALLADARSYERVPYDEFRANMTGFQKVMWPLIGIVVVALLLTVVVGCLVFLT